MNRVARKLVSQVFSLVLIAAIVSPVRAQERGSSTRMSPRVPGSMHDMLRDAAIRAELALTDDQIARLQEISKNTDFFGHVAPIFQKMRTAENEEQRLAAREELRTASEGLDLELEAKAKQVLDERQFRRATEILLQRQGVRALIRPDVARDLAITETQADQLKAAYLEYDAARMMGGLPFEMAERQKGRVEYETKMLGFLTDEQKAKWTARLGVPFSREPVPPARRDGSPRASSLGSSAAGPDVALPSAARRPTASRTSGGERSLPSSYGMIDEDSISGQIRFVVLTEALATSGRTVALNRDQQQLLTNLQTRVRFDHRLSSLVLRLSQARTLEDCAAIRSESCDLLEKWNAEIEQEVKAILGDKAFEQIRPAVLKRQGLWALTRPDVATQLKLTPDQIGQLKTILTDYRAAAAAAPIDAAEQEQMRQAAEFGQKMMKVLTDEQRTQWQEATRRSALTP